MEDVAAAALYDSIGTQFLRDCKRVLDIEVGARLAVSLSTIIYIFGLNGSASRNDYLLAFSQRVDI